MIWIWSKTDEKNSFVEFECPFGYNGGKVELRISADYKYAAYIGNNMVSNGQYADLPTYKSVNKTDITSFVKQGENVLRVVAWHVGEDFSVCRTMKASVAFEILVDGKVVAQSDKTTRCRKAKGYVGGDRITPQLGMGFDYDFTANTAEWENAVEVQTNFVEVERPIKRITVADIRVPKIVAQGVYRYNGGETSADKMQNAWLASKNFVEMTGKNRLTEDTLVNPISFHAQGGDGAYVIADMGRETCGHLGFTVTVDKPCKMLVGWGEHLTDLRIRTKIGVRNFAFAVSLKAGENVFDDYLLRFGCRYLCIFVENESVTVARLGIREVGYPFDFPKKEFGDDLLNAIYETGRRTLYLSAHEHYEDCPWREQALYGMDSRNQMLFGYGAFGEYDYPRANLMLIAKSLQDNGLIPLTAPAEMSITIISFTAYWLIAIGENAEVDYNEAFVKEILPYAERGLNALLKGENENGLSVWTGIDGWNFHEWSEGLDGGEIFRAKEIEEEGDAGLTALTSIAAKKIAYLFERTGEQEKANYYYEKAERLANALENYYDEERGVYASYIKKGVKRGYHEYTQSVVLCAGGVPKNRIKGLCTALKSPLESGLVPATFSALQLKYEALIEHGNDIDYCVQEVKRIFSKMLFSGATSYWETALGEADFEEAGSLCHGWSAVCCWVLDKCK